MIQLLSCCVQIGYAEVEEQSTLTVYSKRIITFKKGESLKSKNLFLESNYHIRCRI